MTTRALAACVMDTYSDSRLSMYSLRAFHATLRPFRGNSKRGIHLVRRIDRCIERIAEARAIRSTSFLKAFPHTGQVGNISPHAHGRCVTRHSQRRRNSPA